MTSYITVTRVEFVGPLDGYVGDVWKVYGRENGVERPWLNTYDPDDFVVGKTYQI